MAGTTHNRCKHGAGKQPYTCRISRNKYTYYIRNGKIKLPYDVLKMMFCILKDHLLRSKREPFGA